VTPARGKLYLVPTGLGGPDPAADVPAGTLAVIRRVEVFFVENAKTARAFLKAAGHPRGLRELRIEVVDERTPHARIEELLEPLHAGVDCALMSEAGAPAVADPGAALVRACHAGGIRVVPLVGPSALLLALMASGLDGQCFAFHGYLPVEREARAHRLAELEAESERRSVTQLFIETPYRNEAMLDSILQNCRPDTLLCLATDITLESESVKTWPVEEWKRARPAIDRRPTVFLIYRERPLRSGRRR